MESRESYTFIREISLEVYKGYFAGIMGAKSNNNDCCLKRPDFRDIRLFNCYLHLFCFYGTFVMMEGIHADYVLR